MKAVITGSRGSVGIALAAYLQGYEETFLLGFDRAERFGRDLVDDEISCRKQVEFFDPDVIYHLAAMKHAPLAEEHIGQTVKDNITATENVLAWAQATKARVVFASTCKAADPETVYGATKLIAERMVLNAGHVVVRFYNIRQSSGNVFEIWSKVPDTAPLHVCNASRYFMDMERAVALLRAAADYPAGRYVLEAEQKYVAEEAARLYPNRGWYHLPLRRGDRRVEPPHARCERYSLDPRFAHRAEPFGVVRKVISHNDPGWPSL